jgi:hypothetical protein
MGNLIEPELERRRVAGETLLTQTEEAKALAAWLVEKHPEAPRVTARPIMNSLREQLRAAVDAKQKALKEDRK